MASEIVETKAIEQVSDRLYKGVSDIIDNARQEVVVYVNKHSDLMFWHIGHYINEDMGYKQYSAYGSKILATLSQRLTARYGKGYTYTAVTRMMKVARFYSDEEMFATLSQTLTWSHFLELVTIEDNNKRLFYQQMGIKDTQFLLVRHFDRSNSVRLLPTGRKNGNPHCHLVYNRINNEGKTITDQHDFRRNEQVTKRLKRKYGLTFSKGKYKTKTERLRGCEKTMVSTNRPKYEIHHLVMNTLAQATSWKDFNSHLKEEGVSMEVVMRTKDSRDMKDVQGIRFTKDGLTFKASQLKRGMTFAKMDSIIRRNAEKAQQAKQMDDYSLRITNCQNKKPTQSHRNIPNHLFLFPHWAYSIQIIPSVTLMRKNLEGGCKRRKRSVDRDYNDNFFSFK